MKYLAILFTLFVALIVLLADMDAIPPFIRALYDFPNGDKVGHFILFGLLNLILTLTALRSLRQFDLKRVALSVGLILALAIFAEEASQLFIPQRTFSPFDLLAGYLGLALGGWIAVQIKK
jgi:polysaccharide biosynthesis protein VpsQ